ncbi:MAG: hypothetical protein GY803_20810 [Chloroflexi bacterium]|nr:hypothetical protein [Chloroflexota bacterium]
MMRSGSYTEESFGILTDDDLYLDCILVKPTDAKDEDLRVLRVWVPKYPLTKSSVITCARQEASSYGASGKIAHLVFDLRGTGNSDSIQGNYDFATDLHAIEEWAKERFGKINFGFLGFPQSDYGRINMWPLGVGSIMESYYYPANNESLTPPTIIYMGSYGNFSLRDDALCVALADSGYAVYGLDPLRYLLHASVARQLTPNDLFSDMRELIQMLPSDPIIIGRPLAAGLAILWAANVNAIRGVIAIGRVQAGFNPGHIFHNRNPYTFALHRQISHITPRPVALALHVKHPLGGDRDELKMLFQNSREPRRLEQTKKLSSEFLLDLVNWIEENQ